MSQQGLGEFEEIVLLAVAILGDEAYGVSIREEITERTGRKVSIGAMQSALKRLETKGFLESEMGEATPTRGGKRKRYFKVTQAGMSGLRAARDVRNQMWDAINPALG
ncbi:MAG TPA: PadR family transcriptional regulator [Cytophagales bacterium]|nr:PadR family transcriptional regulator [Cytophagales bacterium]HAA21602.1 PadR family transcriptional regulator [Cytophagales bacterium]HAP62829.1 PadR family transcriptional regulator [Cytophagales bacterium]